MKLKNVSIKWKVYSMFLFFTIVLISVLWFFQIAHLADFYKLVKAKETEAVETEAVNILFNSETPLEDLSKLAARKNVAIYLTDGEGTPIYNAEFIFNAKNGYVPKYIFERFYEDAKANGGECVEEFQGSNFKRDLELGIKVHDDFQPENNLGEGRLPYTIEEDMGQEYWNEHFMQNYGNEMAQSVMRVRILAVNDSEVVLMVNSVLTPVDATVDTLKELMLVISLIMALVALVFAFVGTRQISKALIEMNDSAKKLAERDYNVEFNADDYKEVAELSETLNFARDELHKTENLQKELIANVSHDLRTPLTMIKGYAEVMRDLPGENTPENVQVVIDETERLTNLVNDMLDISKLQAGTMLVDLDEYNLTESIRQVLGRYNKLQEVDGYTIDFVADEDAFVKADEKKIYQVIYNLVNNAINYTGEDKKVLVSQMIEPDHVLIEVTDSGNGVAEADLPLVWDRYYKVDKAHKRAVQGTGLGLSIVKNILELHEATFGVRNNDGGGATFWFRLPICHP